ncbi:MAG: 2-C-methyl-D-erythritol 2,4-cyclodiphosphate synthase [Chlorobi bacterium]|nr:2-C-methyl-D-erythritol 2,4-cyclodiphosphate synthase [Chlorobiota bacterium]
MKDFRTGFGYDVHAFGDDRKLVLGGVEIPHSQGLIGHSDADALSHALIDSLLGAAALGDIGSHFPDTDLRYRDISSMALLEITYYLLKKHDFEISNIDCTLVLEKPKLSNFINTIRLSISSCLKLDIKRVSVKAKTNEGFGFEGREEGVTAYASCLIYSDC